MGMVLFVVIILIGVVVFLGVYLAPRSGSGDDNDFLDDDFRRRLHQQAMDDQMRMQDEAVRMQEEAFRMQEEQFSRDVRDFDATVDRDWREVNAQNDHWHSMNDGCHNDFHNNMF